MQTRVYSLETEPKTDQSNDSNAVYLIQSMILLHVLAEDGGTDPPTATLLYSHPSMDDNAVITA